MILKISDILKEKNDALFTISPNSTVYEAITEMANQKIGAILIVNANKLVGVFSERDYLNKIVLQGLTSKTTKVMDAMTSEVVIVTPDTPIEEALNVMTQKHFRHLPVLEGPKLVGIVSIGDLIKQKIQDQEITIKYLTDYISSAYQ
jgi:CBS domain-containing protein